MPNITDIARIFNDRENATLKQSLVEKDVILVELLSNAYLRAVLSLIEEHKSRGYKGVDVMHYWTAKFMDGEWNEPAECHKVIPYLQALGYYVTEFDDPWECPFCVDWFCENPTQEDFHRYERNGWRYFPAQDFQRLKATGAFKECRMSDGTYIEYLTLGTLVRRTRDRAMKVITSDLPHVVKYNPDISASATYISKPWYFAMIASSSSAKIFNDQENTTLRQSIIEKDVILEELVANAYLRAILSMIEKHKNQGLGGVDVIHDDMYAFMGGRLYWNKRTESRKVIPFLQALGYGVLDYNDTMDECPFCVDWNMDYKKFLVDDTDPYECNDWKYFPPQDFQTLIASGAFNDCKMSDGAYYVHYYDSDDYVHYYDSDDDSNDDQDD